MSGLLDGQSAIVTGSAGGIGAGFAEVLAEEGATVTLCDVQETVLETAAGIRESGGSAQALVADVSRREDVERVVAAAVEAGGGLDLLVNNAGRWTQSPVTDEWEKAVSDWDLIMDTNFKGVVMFGRACVPHLIARGGGNIINISTYYVLPARSNGTNPPGTDLYASSKWAMNGLTQAWSQKLAEHGIRVNALCMGATDAPMLRNLSRGDPDPAFVVTWMTPRQIAGLALDIIREGPEGRTGENVGAWVGVPVELGPPKPPPRGDHRHAGALGARCMSDPAAMPSPVDLMLVTTLAGSPGRRAAGSAAASNQEIADGCTCAYLDVPDEVLEDSTWARPCVRVQLPRASLMPEPACGSMAGYAENSSRGVWSITDQGQARCRLREGTSGRRTVQIRRQNCNRTREPKSVRFRDRQQASTGRGAGPAEEAA